MSIDEASAGFVVDAPDGLFSVGPFQSFVESNTYGYITNGTLQVGTDDYDGYGLFVDIGAIYFIVPTGSPLYGGPTPGRVSFELRMSDGQLVSESVSIGGSDRLTFTADRSNYIVNVTAEFDGFYGFRVGNDSVTETNPIGENILLSAPYSGNLDFSSDVDSYSAFLTPGKSYKITLLSTPSDLYLNIKNSNLESIADAIVGVGGEFIFTAASSDFYTLNFLSNSLSSLGEFAFRIDPYNYSPTGEPVILGIAEEGEQLVTDASALADEDGLGAFSYQWLANGSVISGAAASSYTPGESDVGKAISVRVSYNDGQGTNESLTSTATAAVTNVNDSPTGSVPISGIAREDEVLTAVTSTLADDDGLGSFSYQWLSDGTAISGATKSSYTLGQSDVGKAVSVRVSYKDGQGTDEKVTSAATGKVTNVNDAPVGDVSISGETLHNAVLTVATEKISDDDGLGAFTYQWLRNGKPISGEDKASLDLSAKDVGKKISVEVSFTDGEGNPEVLVSDPTSKVKWADLKLVGSKRGDDLVGAGGNDTLIGKGGGDKLVGKAGKDTLNGGAGKDDLNGGGGADQLIGSGGNDKLNGAGGADELSGGAGKDFLDGGKGNDALTGGAQADVFSFKRGSGKDVITDFEIGVDTVEIGKGAKRFGQLTFEEAGADVVMTFSNVEVTFQDTLLEEVADRDYFVF